MPEKCYEKLVSNLILGVRVAVFEENSRVEDWKSGHRKMNSLLETFLIRGTKLDRILLKTNFGIKTQKQIYCSRLYYFKKFFAEFMCQLELPG